MTSHQQLAWLVTGAALFGVACQGGVVPGSAQVGSTITIPFGGNYDQRLIGYGGTEFADLQRGQMVVMLDGTDCAGLPCELVTRFTFPVGAVNDVTINGLAAEEYLIMADIPIGTPSGAHQITIVNRTIDPVSLLEVDRTITNDFVGTITILDPNVAGYGTPTPFDYWNPGQAAYGQPLLNWGIPDPRLQVDLVMGTPPGPYSGKRMASASFQIDYPASEMMVNGVLSMAPSNSAAWLEHVDADTINVHTAAITDSWVRGAYVLFEPAGADPVDLSGVTSTLLKVTDANGNDVISQWGVTAVAQVDAR